MHISILTIIFTHFKVFARFFQRVGKKLVYVALTDYP